MNQSFGSQNFVRENNSKSLVSIFSADLELLNSFLLDFYSRRGFTNLDVLLTPLFSDDLKFESTKGCFLFFKS